MKKFIITSILVALFATGTTVMAQDNQEDYLGLPGDNLNLYAVMKLFQESKTLEDFERSLNDEKNNINNLDLNDDNLVDYIRVIDNIDNDVHNIVLQVAVNEKESQDVAVFTVQRFDNGQVMIQLTGDEELYGKDYIIEPNFDDANAGETPNPGYTGNNRTINGQNVTYVRTTTIEIAAWPLVRFIYLPSYTIWRSSWYWGYYPSYWHPWRPFYWHYYYGYHYNWYHDYYGHYRRWHYHRYSRWNDFYYTGRRSFSPDVYHRVQIGSYKTTYSHPDQRKDGETMFAKTHPDQYRRSTDNSSVDRDRVSTSTSRRSDKTLTNKSVTNRSSDKNTGITRRSSTTVINKSSTNPPSDKNTVTSRKSSSTVIRRSEANAPSGQNAVSNRTSRQSKPSVVSSSNRRSSNKSETKSKQEVKTKESKNKETNRRK